jgi:hypothetical protein
MTLMSAVATGVSGLPISANRMNAHMIGKSRLLASDEPEGVDLAGIAFEPNPKTVSQKTLPYAKKAIIVGTREIDPRVLVQQGAFTIHADDTDLADIAGTWRIAFRVPGARKGDVQEILRSLAITKMSLFPDLAALAEELKSRRFK